MEAIMKKIGMVGGLGPEPTMEYYNYIIKYFRKKEGREDTPDIIIYSVNLQEFLLLFEKGEGKKIVDRFLRPIEALHLAGADFALIAAGTPHMFFDDIRDRSPLPLLSMVEETARRAQSMNLKKLLLLGTKFTMGSDFFQKVFGEYGMRLTVPERDEQVYIHSKLIGELQFGEIVPATRERTHLIIKEIIQGEPIDGIILGCTELPLLMPEEMLFGLPLLNTARIHAESAVEYCLR
jgi:aspartate racemase